MRNNQPVTQREVYMKDGSCIVSSTDDKGRIQFMNEDFIEISGFTKDELMSQPHNIIRHPDMPPEAFEDLWRDLKAGLPWSGYVKNRTKNGDHYWVLANAMPVVENGRTTGYISIRSKPDAATTQAVGRIYQQFREGKAGSLAIEHGRVVDKSSKATFKRRFERIGGKIAAVAAVLCAMIILISGVGFYINSQITESLRTVYEDRTVPAGQLADINRLLQGNMYNLSSAVPEPKDQAIKDAKDVEDALPEMRKVWADYMATYLTPEEKVLATRYNEEQDQMIKQVFLPGIELARSGKSQELQRLLTEKTPLFDQAVETNDKLVQLQLNVAKEEYELAKKHGTVGICLSLTVLLAGLVVAFMASRYLSRVLNSKLQYLDARLGSIMSGNYQTEVAVGDDELQNIMITVRALQAKLAYGELEKAQLAREKKTSQNQLADRFESEVGGVVGNISAAATELQATAESMSATAEETSSQAGTVAAASEQATANVQTVSAATEELTASIKEIQSQVAQSTRKITEAVAQANAANEKVLSLTQAAQKIGSVVDIIREIAGQTNLLALNATIEAARAGEAGKGFAVVASEVKSLAGQTAKATEEIAQQVGHIQSETQHSVEAIQLITGMIDEVNRTATAIAAAVEEQGTATQEIARNVAEAAQGTQEVSSNITGVREAAQTTGAASSQVLSAAGELARHGEALKAQVSTFLNNVRNQ